MKSRILLLTPPFVQLNTPYPATAALSGFLRSRGFDVTQRDLSIETALEVMHRFGDEVTDELIEFLQGPAPIDAKHEAALHLDEVAAAIAEQIDPDFGFSRYAERLGVAVPDFAAVSDRLRRKSPIDRILEEMTEQTLAEAGFLSDKKSVRHFVGISCPFPGTLIGAFRIAKTIRRLLPGATLVLGGGYVNTELRDTKDRRIGRYFDVLMFDEGYAPWIELLNDRTNHAFDGKVRMPLRLFATGHDVPVYVEPDYHGLDMSLYLDMPESENPMHRLWSAGRWIKIQLARGCYWHRCAFCDVNLEYIKCFEMPDAKTVVDSMERLVRQTGTDGFHFTDEAIPPALARSMSKEIIRRGFKCRWWGNIRFDKAYAGDLPGLMAKAGCIAVTGGLECAQDRLLKLMEKGITQESAKVSLRAFSDAGIMVHAYLMYGFPTQTEQEAREALEYVRDRFREGSVQSAFFHRFALTVHSPIARSPEKFGIKIVKPDTAGRFALNEIQYLEKNAPDWDSIGKALKLALYNYMLGMGLDRPVSFWFDQTRRRKSVRR